MNTKKQKKAGFTLVELMVVAIIVAILAAVAIPLMSGNTDRAMATEAQAGCSTVATGIKLWVVEGSETGETNGIPTIVELPGITAADLQGNYFKEYSVDSVGSANTYTITASPGADGKASADVTMTVVNGTVTWTGLGQD
ncbi:prepilin-type N-terminal cleavage/methylation domain-containing protein [Pontiellaceae bacterium B1224]|nr:prepilin-type N-terminal cleavage/methylation domain-containing protein [Pontiellaceae bacterium B1224]